MTQITPIPEANISLVKGAAIIAIVYHSIIFVTALVCTLSISGMALAILNNSSRSGRGGDGDQLARELLIILVISVITTFVLLALSIWMLVSVRRNHPWQCARRSSSSQRSPRSP